MEYELIREEAEILGISAASFGRSTIVNMALRLKAHREAGIDSIEAKEEDDGVRSDPKRSDLRMR